MVTHNKKITVPDVVAMKQRGEKIAMLTAYSYSVARFVDASGLPIILVGDSVAMVEAGYDSTLPVTMDEMVYHARCVARACEHSLVVADMPFMSFQSSVADALRNAGRFVKEAGVGAVKVEGGVRSTPVIKALVDAGIPVMAHIGLTPQSVKVMGGYKVQGKTKESEKGLIKDARAIEKAGAFSVVLECMPISVAEKITKVVSIPTIGIGAGPGCDGQVLVINDMLGLTEGALPRFVKKYADLGSVIKKAATQYKKDVESGSFPAKEHSYK